MTDWTQALRTLVEESLGDFIRHSGVTVRCDEIVSPNPGTSGRLYGGLALVAGDTEVRFYVEVVDAISACDIYKKGKQSLVISDLVEEIIPEEKMGQIMKKIGTRFHEVSYGFLLARAQLHCDVLASRLAGVFTDPAFNPEVAIRKPGLLEEARIARWAS